VSVCELLAGNSDFLRDVESHYARISLDRMECLMHGHGHTAQDIYRLRYSTFERIPDVVIWPGSHEQVEVILRLAHEHNVVVIPFGGGTTVTEALEVWFACGSQSCYYSQGVVHCTKVIAVACLASLVG
jgi:hypothetical protein